MEIYADSFLKIMRKNFDYKSVKTELGEGIRMDPYSAFIYSAVTGARYLDNPDFPFTPKGRMRLFYNALDYNFVTGLFDNTSLYYTPYNISRSKPYLFKEDKIIIPIEFERDIDLIKISEDFIDSHRLDSTNYLIQRIEISKNGNGMEPFLEYLCSEFFKKEGYIVETQIPLSHKDGTPDFGGYFLIKFRKFIENFGLPLQNIHLLELAMIRIRIKSNYLLDSKTLLFDDRFVVGEAKPNNASMKLQLIKYLKTGFFNEGYQLSPTNNKLSPFLGSLFIDSEYNVIVKKPTEENKFQLRDHQQKYSIWLLNYIKYYLISNLTNDEFNDFFIKNKKRKISSKHDIIDFINNLTYEDILNEIRLVSKWQNQVMK